MTNEQRSAAEVAAFIADEPGPYFAYYKARDNRWMQPGQSRVLASGDLITTWTGERLGTIKSVRPAFRSNMDDLRQNVRVLGVNGATYSGTAYLSAGDYVRLRPVKP